MKQQALLYPDKPMAGDVRVLIHNGHEWTDLTGNVKDINFISYTNSGTLSAGTAVTGP